MKALEELKQYFVDGAAILLFIIAPVCVAGTFVWITWPAIAQIIGIFALLILVSITIGMIVSILKE